MSAESSPHYDPADVSIPRVCVLKEFTGDPGPCPRCKGRLRQYHHTYLVATRRGGEPTDFFVMGGDFGWFCLDCPTVVINTRRVKEMLQEAAFRWDVGEEYAILGLVDLDAIPEEKEHLPLGSDENPIPLVEFTNIRSGVPTPSGRPRVKKARARRKRKKRRSKKRR